MLWTDVKSNFQLLKFMIMKKVFFLLITILIIAGSVMLFPESSQAQTPPPPPTDKPIQNPIDGGLAILAVAGGAYGIKKLRDKKS